MRSDPRWAPLALAGIVAGSAALLAVGTARVHEWIVMTDELLYTKLARHVATTGSPLPSLHAEHVGFLGIGYPLALAPFYGALGAPDAFEAAHIVNAVLFASTAIPVYLLARRLTGPVPSLVVSLLAIAVPWCLQAAVVMSEALAYPVFAWVVLALHRSVSEPSPRRDAVAAGALAAAFLTRPQFAFLALVLPVAVAVVDGRRALGRHRALAILYAVGLTVVIVMAALGEQGRLLGDYGVTATQGSILPLIAWKSAALHLDVLALGLGVLPLLLGGGWTYSRLRDGDRRRRAFAAVTAAALPLIALETASYDVRFGGSDVIRDRYLFYVAPLLLLASALCLQEPRLPRAGIAAVTAVFVVTVCFADFTPVAGVWFDSPQSVQNGVIHDLAPGLPAGVFVALCGAALGAACLAIGRLPRRTAAVGVTVAVFAFAASTAGYGYARLLGSNTPQGIPVTGQARVRDWVDRAGHGDVALLAYPISRLWGQSAIVWWDVEQWNNRVARALGTWTYTPFPTTRLRLDWATGEFEDTGDAAPSVLAAANDSRFELAGTEAATNVGLVLRQVDRPYRALWASRGLDADGWARPDRPATIRIYGSPGRHEVEALLDAPPEATAPASYRLGGASGSVAPGQRATAQTSVCIPQSGHADLPLRTAGATRIGGEPRGPDVAGERDVTVALSGVEVGDAAGACRP